MATQEHCGKGALAQYHIGAEVVTPQADVFEEPVLADGSGKVAHKELQKFDAVGDICLEEKEWGV